MTSAILVQRSTNWGLATLWVCNVPKEDEEYKWIYESWYIWTAEPDMKIWLIIIVMDTT